MHRLVTEAPEVSTEKVCAYRQREPFKPRRWLRIALVSVVLAFIVCVALLAARWPFTRSKVIADLEGAMQGRVEIGKFQQTWFPPGCVAEDVTFKGYGNLPGSVPMTVRKLTIQSSFQGLFTGHVSVLLAEGVYVTAPNAGYFSGWQQGQGNSKPAGSKIVIDKFIATESVLEFSRGAEKPPLQFAISRLELNSPDAHGVQTFQTTLHNPEPPGEVQASGYLGPWKTENSAQTPIAGSYSFKRANLAAFHGIAGTLSSDGSFQGTVGQLDVRGKTLTPDFEVTDTGHTIPLVTEFQARVTTRDGNVSLERVNARLGKSSIQAAGNITKSDDQKGKVVSVNLLVRNGRIQDFLFLLLKDPAAPMTGTFNFKGVAILPPEKAQFTKKIQLQGDFGVEAGHVTKPVTQANLEALSERAEGEKDDPPERVLSDLQGHFVLRQGIATSSNLSFSVPGAVARLHGTYDLLAHRINLRGTLFMKANLSQATKGVKSFLLKVINPFLKKNHRGGAVIPVTITGIYPHPVYRTDPI
ncbi:MAG TPA: AsmA-like C-terminal region-containing protein [Candidatus Angelobacter sp.]